MNRIFQIDSLDRSIKMHVCSDNPKYRFYHRGDYPTSAPEYYQNLVDSASTYIEIWDPYFNVGLPNSDQDIFRNINNDVTIKILTMKGISSSNPYLPSVENALRTVIPPAKNTRFGLRVINKGDSANQGERFFHDRFLIIDRRDVYLVGSSIGYHLRPELSTGIYNVTDNDTSQFIQSIFDAYWNLSTHHEIAIKYLHP